jgi:hypothetical protein
MLTTHRECNSPLALGVSGLPTSTQRSRTTRTPSWSLEVITESTQNAGRYTKKIFFFSLTSGYSSRTLTVVDNCALRSGPPASMLAFLLSGA